MWPQRAYIGLYSGAGRAKVEGTGKLVETSAMAVLRQEVPFTKYIFVDADERCITALERRIAALGAEHDVTLIHDDVNRAGPQILNAMPTYTTERGLLSLCFIDPFRADLRFDVIRQLSRYKMDFLVMLPLGYDLRRNLRRYLDDQDDTRVAALIDDPEWRLDWRAYNRSDRHFVLFLLEKFDQAMERLGFRRREMQDTVNVRVAGMGVFLYALALYSKNERGQEFWKTTITGTNPQLDLDLTGES